MCVCPCAKGYNSRASQWLSGGTSEIVFGTPYGTFWDHRGRFGEGRGGGGGTRGFPRTLSLKRVLSCNPMRGLRESGHETSQAYFRLPQSRLQDSTKRTYARDTRPFFQTVHLQTNSGQTDSVVSGGRDGDWSARRQQLAVIMYIYTYNFSPRI